MTSVSTSAFYESAIFNMDQLRQSTNKLQQQISTGNKIVNSYDDPVAAAQMRSLKAMDSLSQADTANANAAKTKLTQTDDTLTQFTTIVSDIQALATQAANDTLTTDQRKAIGVQVSAYYQNLVSLANTKDVDGKPLFGGTADGAAYTTNASGVASYNGAGSVSPISLGSGLSVTPGMTGPEILNFTMPNGGTGDLLSTVKNLGDALQAGTATSATMNAAGGAMDQLNASLNQLTTSQTVIGARLAWITTTTNIQTQMASQRTTRETDVGGTDIATAMAQLSQQMLVLNASQASFAKMSSLSLFNALN